MTGLTGSQAEQYLYRVRLRLAADYPQAVVSDEKTEWCLRQVRIRDKQLWPAADLVAEWAGTVPDDWVGAFESGRE
ncbi:hypothetical protein ACFXG4_48260 [Nocardia sp. NPDC059246]|uniref:hypothetical protein n=1 Tax=unclassified Nocardia TaxID=2637762 RepID=UPI00368E811F